MAKRFYYPSYLYQRLFAYRQPVSALAAVLLLVFVVVPGSDSGKAIAALSPADVQALKQAYNQTFGGTTANALRLTPEQKSVELDVSVDIEKEKIIIDKMPIGLAIAVNQTLQDDMVIRISSEGFDFVARVVQRLMMGWVRRNYFISEAKQSILVLLNDLFIGYKAGFPLDVPVVGQLTACGYVGNSNDDNLHSGSCACGEGTPGSSGWGDDKICSNCVIKDFLDWYNGGAMNGGGQAWPDRWSQAAADQGAGQPYGDSAPGWGTAGPGNHPCSQIDSTGKFMARYKDPANPQAQNDYWCKGPFFDYSLAWANHYIDPDCLKPDPAITEPGGCPDIGMGDNGTKCDNQCLFSKSSNRSTTTGDATYISYGAAQNCGAFDCNDVPIDMVIDKANNRLIATITLQSLALDLRLAVYGGLLNSLGCVFCVNPPGPTYGGSILGRKNLFIPLWISFNPGYMTMRGRDGDSCVDTKGCNGTSSSSSSSSGGKGSCTLSPSSVGLDFGGVGRNLQSDALLGVGVSMDVSRLDLIPDITAGELPGIQVCVGGWLCDMGGAIFGALLPLFEGMINDMIGGAIESLLGSQIQKLIENELGLPIDMNAIVAHPGGLAKDVCALRMPTASDGGGVVTSAKHVKGMGCSHRYRVGTTTASPRNPMNCNSQGLFDGVTRNQACRGFGDCPCDDYDADYLLNYQDPSPFDGDTGYVAFSGQVDPPPYGSPAVDPGLIDDCNRGGKANVWCGAWNTTFQSSENYYSWYYGVATFFKDEGGIYFEAGMYMDDVWDDYGFNLVLDASLVPWRDHTGTPANLTVQFFTNINYTGASCTVTVTPGGAVVQDSDLGVFSSGDACAVSFNNNIRSVKVSPGAVAQLYDNANFSTTGTNTWMLLIHSDDPDLTKYASNGAARVSSYRIFAPLNKANWSYQGKIPDPTAVMQAGMRGTHPNGQLWSSYISQLPPTSRSCYYDATWEGNYGNLWLDGTQRDNSLVTRDEATVKAVNRWLVGMQGNATAELQLRRLGGSLYNLFNFNPNENVSDVELAATGQHIIAGTTTGSVKVWRLEGTGDSWVDRSAGIRQFTGGGSNQVNAVAISPSANYVAIGYQDGRVDVYKWDSSTQKWSNGQGCSYPDAACDNETEPYTGTPSYLYTRYWAYKDTIPTGSSVSYSPASNPNPPTSDTTTCEACPLQSQGTTCKACPNSSCVCDLCSLTSNEQYCGCAACPVVSNDASLCGCANRADASNVRYDSGSGNGFNCAENTNGAQWSSDRVYPWTGCGPGYYQNRSPGADKCSEAGSCVDDCGACAPYFAQTSCDCALPGCYGCGGCEGFACFCGQREGRDADSADNCEGLDTNAGGSGRCYSCEQAAVNPDGERICRRCGFNGSGGSCSSAQSCQACTSALVYRACLFDGVNFTGAFTCFNSDDTNYGNTTAPDAVTTWWNDRASSLFVPPGARVILFQDGGYATNPRVFETSSPDLSTVGLNNNVSSHRIYAKNTTIGKAGSRESVCFHYNIDFATGGSNQYWCDRQDSWWVGGTDNDQVSSISVPLGWKVAVYNNINYNHDGATDGAGKALITQSYRNLADVGLNDYISSYKIQRPVCFYSQQNQTPDHFGNASVPAGGSGSGYYLDAPANRPLCDDQFDNDMATTSKMNPSLDLGSGRLSRVVQGGTGSSPPALLEYNWANIARSVSVPDTYKLTVYTGTGYSGNSAVFYGNANLTGVFDATANGGQGVESYRIKRAVCFYQGLGFTGTKTCFDDPSVADLTNAPNGAGNWNDKIRSIRIPTGFAVTLYKDANFAGDYVVLNEDQAVLPSGQGINWDSIASSLTIDEAVPAFEGSNINFCNSYSGGCAGGGCAQVAQCRLCYAPLSQDQPGSITCNPNDCAGGCALRAICTEPIDPNETENLCTTCGIQACGTCTRQLDGHPQNAAITDLKWHPSKDKYLVSTANNAGVGQTDLWDPTEKRRYRQTWRRHQGYKGVDKPLNDVNGTATKIRLTEGSSRIINELVWSGNGERIAVGYSDGNVDKLYGVDNDEWPLAITDNAGVTQWALTKQGCSRLGDTSGCSGVVAGAQGRWINTERPAYSGSNCNANGSVLSVDWGGDFDILAVGHCNGAGYGIQQFNANLAHNGGSVTIPYSRAIAGTNLKKARFTADGRVVYADNTAIYVWNQASGAIDYSETHPAVINALSSAKSGKFEEYFDDFDVVNQPDSKRHHFSFITSQQFFQELFYTLYYSGLFCINFEAGSDISLLDDLLKVENMRGIVPYLGDVDPVTGNFIWSQNEPVSVRFRPRDVPIVKVLGGRNNACFPNGDLIPSSNVIDSLLRDEGISGGGSARVDDAEFDLNILTPQLNTCAVGQTANLSEVGRFYDLLVYLPHFQVEFWAPLSDPTPPYDPYANRLTKIYTQELHLGMAMAIEYDRSVVNQGIVGAFEILIDAFLGCAGNAFDNSWGSYTINWYGGLNDNCGIVQANLPYSTDTGNGISDLFHTLLNGTLSVLIKSKLTFAGLQVDFYKVGAGFPTEGGGPDAAALDSDTGYGENTPDFLVGTGRFTGGLDISALFSILGAPPVGGSYDYINTLVSLPGSSDGPAIFADNVFEQHLSLTPAESYQAGFGQTGARIHLSAIVGRGDQALAKGQGKPEIYYSWRIGNYGNWRPYGKGDMLVLPYLPTGRYDIEIRAKTADGWSDDTPAVVSFWVDKVAPSVRVFDQDGKYIPHNGEQALRSNRDLKLKIQDNISSQDNVDVLFAVDNGEWRKLAPGNVVPLAQLKEIQDGYEHRITIRASDEFNNITQIELLTDGRAGGGCSVGSSNSTWQLLLAMILVVLWQLGLRYKQQLLGRAWLLVVTVGLLLLPSRQAVAANFVIEFGTDPEASRGQQSAPLLADVPLNLPLLGLAGAADITAPDQSFFLYLDAQKNTGPDPAKCPKNTAHSGCLSFTSWAERTIATLLDYRPFQDQIQKLINGFLDPTPQDVCFYTAANYGGTQFCYKASVASLSGAANNSFRSVKVPKGMVVTGYDSTNYNPSNPYKRFVGDVPDLGTTLTPGPSAQSMNAVISSIWIETWGAPLMDEPMSIPLIGDFNLGFFIHDLWGSASPWTEGPKLVANPTIYLATKFADDDTVAVDLLNEVFRKVPKPYSFSIIARGQADSTVDGALGESEIFDGSLEFRLRVDALDVDVIFAQPPEPVNITTGVYMHAGGKLRLSNLDLVLRLYTAAGNLRDLIDGRSKGSAAGTDIGLGLVYAKIQGSLVLDLDVFDCWDNPYLYCDAAKLASNHPQYNNQVKYEEEVNQNSKTLGDAIPYLEMHLVYEVERFTGGAEDYLTALSLLDLRELTHPKLPDGNYGSLTLSHPFISGENLYLDYSGFWRFNSQEDAGGNRGGLVLPGGYGIAITHDAPAFCQLNNYKPAQAGSTEVLWSTLDAPVIGESGTVTINGVGTGNHTVVTLSKRYTNPAVVAFIRSRAEADSVDVRAYDINFNPTGPTQFRLAMFEPTGGAHAAETVSWLAMEVGSGHWTLIDGTKVKVGKTVVGNTLGTLVHRDGDSRSGNGVLVTFSGAAFSKPPVLLHTLNTNGNNAFMSSAAHSISATQFYLQQERGGSTVSVASETIGWIAFEDLTSPTNPLGTSQIQGQRYYAFRLPKDGDSQGHDGDKYELVQHDFVSIPGKTADVIIDGNTETLSDNDGYWARGRGATKNPITGTTTYRPPTTDYTLVYTEEDTVGDSERLHSDESFSVLAMESGMKFRIAGSTPSPSVHQMNVARNNRNAMLGFGVHLDPLNSAIDKLWESHVLCLQADANTPEIGDALANILNTDAFSTFWPGVPDAFAGRDMAIRFIPRYVATHKSGSQASADAAFNAAADQPRVKYCNEDNPCSPSNDPNDGPYDLELLMPHLEIQFLVDEDPSSAWHFIPMFSTEISVAAWLGLGVYTLTPTLFPEDVDISGCLAAAVPCTVARLNVAVTSYVNAIYEYNAAQNVSYNPVKFRNGISSLLAAFFTSMINVELELGLQLGSPNILGMSISPVTDASNPPTGVYRYGVGIESIDLIPADLDPRPQYLALYLNIDDQYGSYNQHGTATSTDPDGYADVLPPSILSDMILSAIEPLLGDLANLSAAPALASNQPLLHKGWDAPVWLELPSIGYSQPRGQLSLAESNQANLRTPGAIIKLSTLTSKPADAIRYHYQIDNGFYQYAKGDSIVLPYLFDGRHQVEVWAVDDQGVMSSNPARLEFVVDNVAPSIIWQGDTSLLGQDREVTIGYEVRDLVSDPHVLQVYWRIDDADWVRIPPSGVLTANVRQAGAHSLEVKAIDESGNQRVRRLDFYLEGGGGCSASAHGNLGEFLIMLLFIVFGYAATKARNNGTYVFQPGCQHHKP